MDKQKALNLFKKSYKNQLSESTYKKYLAILDQLLDKKCKIKSKSKFLQVKATIKKAETIGIEIKQKIIEYSKRSSNQFQKHITNKYINETQFERLIKLVPNSEKGNELALAIEISYKSGLRLSEVLNLTKKDIVIHADRTIELRIDGKGNKFRKVYLPKNMIESIKVFKRFTISVCYVETTFKRMLKKYYRNYKEQLTTSFHGLRHSFVTNLVKNGLSVLEVKDLAGHSSLDTTYKYIHLEQSKPKSLAALGY